MKLRELKEEYIKVTGLDDKEIMDQVVMEHLNAFVKFAKEKERERKASMHVQDPSPMIGLNPFKRDTIADGDHLSIPPAVNTRDFNKLLNYRVNGEDGTEQ